MPRLLCVRAIYFVGPSVRSSVTSAPASLFIFYFRLKAAYDEISNLFARAPLFPASVSTFSSSVNHCEILIEETRTSKCFAEFVQS